MKRYILLLTCCVSFAAASSALAACTPEEAQEKSREFIDKAILFSQKDTAAYSKIIQEAQEKLPKLQQTKDYDGLCKFYDALIKKVE